LILDDKWYNLEFLKRLLLECNPARIFLIAFREKSGQLRNDFLDCMMELRQASKDEVQDDVQSTKNEDTGATFSKLQEIEY